MCGILGIVGDDVPPTLPLATLRHRGPDASGCWTNGRTCVLGSTRLAIVDLDARANQPMRDPSGRYVIIFNGEIYNHAELRQQWLSGVSLRSTSDTEVLLHLWAKMGVDCLPLLRGMFAFAIWDEQAEALFLIRDRMGKKPLFYCQDEGRLAFASELVGLLPLIRRVPEIDVASLDLFLAYQFVPCPQSIYRGVFKLPPAHYGVWRRGVWSTHRYWELRFEPSTIAEGEAEEELEHRVREATRIRLRADVPVGALLSGGVDSGLIVALAAQEYGRPIQTFSIGFKESEFNELPHAKAVAERYGTDHHPIVLTEGTSELFLEAVRRYGEPFADKSALPSLLVCREASRSVKVVLNGDGGDELFGGYAKYQIRALHRPFSRMAEGGAWVGGVIDALARDFPRAGGRLLRRMRNAVSPLSAVTHFDGFVRAEDQRRLYWPDVFEVIRPARHVYERALLSELPLPHDLLAKLLHIDYRHYLANDLLVKMDIASMSYSLEARSPLLDHTLFEFAARLPATLKVRRRTGKYLLKRLAERYLPREAIYRPKQGFSIPLSQWMRDRFRPELEALFASHEPLWAYCRPNTVRRWLNEHLTGRQEHGQRLWAILVLGTWLREEKIRRERAVRHRGVPAEASWSGTPS